MSDIPVWWEDLKFFRPGEMFYDFEAGRWKPSFPEPGKMDYQMMLDLDEAREFAGIPFIITSSYRPDDDGAHGKGLAVDVRAHGNWERERIYEALTKVGFPRRGIYNAHIHGDTDPDLPPGIWGGKSS